VEALFHNLLSYDIDNFLYTWDFLNKRFFFHLDMEHLNLCGLLKADLIKFYLINAVKNKSKDRVLEFFTNFSFEILAESANTIPGNLRGWFVLPYIEEPEKDPEFSIYFSQKWSELLKITLHNFLSIVISSAPPPKLLQLEKWFRSESQQDLLFQLRISTAKIDYLVDRIDRYEDRLQYLREVIRGLVNCLLKAYQSQPHTSSNIFLSSTESKIVDVAMTVSRITAECARKTAILGNLSKSERIKEALGEEYFSISSNSTSHDHFLGPTTGSSFKDLEELEANLIGKLVELMNRIEN